MYVPFVISWIRNHAGDGWQYKFRDDKNNRDFVAKNFPFFLKSYDGFKQGVQRADAVRYMLLYKYGGIYADLDTTCIQPFDSLLEEMNDKGEEPTILVLYLWY